MVSPGEMRSHEKRCVCWYRLPIRVAFFAVCLVLFSQLLLFGPIEIAPVAAEELHSYTPTTSPTPRFTLTPTAGPTLLATPTPSRAPSPVPTTAPTQSVSTPTVTTTVAPAGTPTATPTVTAWSTPTPTLIAAPTPTQTETRTPNTTTSPTVTQWLTPTLTLTATPTEIGTPMHTATVTQSPFGTPSLTATASVTPTATISMTVTPTLTPTGTITTTPTVTGTPALIGVLQLALTPRESSVVPGGSANYIVSLTNASTITTIVMLTATNSIPTTFTTSLKESRFKLAPGASAITTLTVTASTQARQELINETVLSALVNGVERATSTAITRLLLVKFSRALAGMGVSDHSVSPATQVDMQIGITALAPLTRTVLVEYVPRSWVVLNPGGGTVTVVNMDTQMIEWPLGDTAPGAVLTKTYRLYSPGHGAPQTRSYFYSVLSNSGYNLQSEIWSVLLAHPLRTAHYRIGWDAPLDKMTYVAGPDTTARGIPRFKAFRVRFQVINSQSSSVRWQPRLEWSPRADSGFQLVPPGDAVTGQPFYIRPLREIANSQVIRASDFGLGQDLGAAQDGYIFTMQNPAPVLALNPFSYTEIEFSVRAPVDAAYMKDYYFRLTDDDRLVPGLVARIVMASSPPLQLTRPQFAGIDPNAGAGIGPWSSVPGSTLTGVWEGNLGFPSGPAFTSPHGPYTAVSDTCALCHRGHTGKNRNTLSDAPAQSNLCFSCHDGTGSTKNIQRQYTDASVPANSPGTSSFYSHAATTPSSHTAAKNDEFPNVLNRHSECGDCHNPHSADPALSSGSGSGWTASGALKNVSGVGVTNSGAGTTPTFAWKNPITYEYELCLKCHSAYTTLLSYAKESYKKLDKGAEFNPANPSYHPIEAAGKNTTAKMANNLAGTSPYKLWNFTTSSVVRCVHCHGDYRLANPASPPAGNVRLAPHTSRYRSLLMNNLRDRVLTPTSSTNNYSASDFALCYQCHSEAPYVDRSGDARSDSNFRFHGYHVTNIYDNPGDGGASTDIDTPGAGQGNAICSECHYRMHGQGRNARGNASGSRLVNFAPNVTASSGGQLKWEFDQQTQKGQCYLTCHGKDHNPEEY